MSVVFQKFHGNFTRKYDTLTHMLGDGQFSYLLLLLYSGCFEIFSWNSRLSSQILYTMNFFRTKKKTISQVKIKGK